MRLFTSVDLALTKLMFHPEREKFLSVWQHFFNYTPYKASHYDYLKPWHDMRSK